MHIRQVITCLLIFATVEGLCAPSGKSTAPPIAQLKAGSYIFDEHDARSSPSSCKAPTAVKDNKVSSLHRRNNGKYTLGPDPTIEMLGEYPYISIGEETTTPLSCATRLESFIVQDEGYSTGELCEDPDNRLLYVKVFKNVELTRNGGSSLFYPSSLRVAMEINALRSTGQIEKWKYYIDPSHRRSQSRARGHIYLYIERLQVAQGYYLMKDIPHRWQAPIEFQQHFTRNLYLAVQGAIYHYAEKFGIFNGHLTPGNVFVGFLDGRMDGRLGIIFADWSYTQKVVKSLPGGRQSPWTILEPFDQQSILRIVDQVTGHSMVLVNHFKDFYCHH